MKYIYIFERLKEYQINDERSVLLVLLAKRAFCDDIEGVNSKHVLLAPLACSNLPSVTMSLTYGLKQGWATTFHQGPHEKPELCLRQW